MFVASTVRFPCHAGGHGHGHGHGHSHGYGLGHGVDGGRRSSAGASTRPFGDETYLAAGSCSYDAGQNHNGHFGSENARCRSWSGVLPFPSTKHESLEAYYLHHHWRAIMGEEAWYQSISDFEEAMLRLQQKEGNYFNSPHLQHGRHGNAATMEDENGMAGIINMSAYMSNTKTASDAYHLHDDAYFATETMMQSPNEQLPPTWPIFAPDGAHEVEQEMFAGIDISRDLDHLVHGPMADLDGLPRSPRLAQEMLQAPAPIMMHGHGQPFGSPAASPMTSTASQEEDMCSAYSPNMGHQSHSAYAPYLMGETPVLRPQARGPSSSSSSWSSSPLRHERSHHQSLRRVRKSLPNSPMRNHAAARSAGFADSMSPPSEASAARCKSPGVKEPRALRTASPFSSSSPMHHATGERASKDEFLVKSRRAGMTYRDIKQQGGFAEAESTLRGRFRMLTKSREERVRNPKWTPVDVVLLRKAVLKFCNGKDPVLVKVPWKEVARFILDNGGTYLFGNATCRKKWDELASFGIDEEVEDVEQMCIDGERDCEGEEEMEDDDEDDDEGV